jgi:hypothetical protein
MLAEKIAARSASAVELEILDRLEECLCYSPIDLRISTNLVLSDGVLLASVLRVAEYYGAGKYSNVSDCIVVCGTSRLLQVCRALRQQGRARVKHSAQRRETLQLTTKLGRLRLADR